MQRKPAGWLDRSIVIAQVALALLLVSSAGLLAATLRNLREVDGGFATTHVLMATADTRGTSREREGAIPMHSDLLDRVRRIQGVRMAAMSKFASTSFRDYSTLRQDGFGCFISNNSLCTAIEPDRRLR